MTEPKATEPSDAELSALWVNAPGGRGASNRALYNAGRASRDAEVEALKAERDNLHAALAWREKSIASVHCYDGATSPYWALCRENELWETEPHDGTDAGRSAALVRLWERCK